MICERGFAHAEGRKHFFNGNSDTVPDIFILYLADG